MAKRCVYCKRDISQESAVDVCEKCGIGVWGEKMFKAIKDNMNNAREKGDLFQGSVGFSETELKDSSKLNNRPTKSF